MPFIKLQTVSRHPKSKKLILSEICDCPPTSVAHRNRICDLLVILEIDNEVEEHCVDDINIDQQKAKNSRTVATMKLHCLIFDKSFSSQFMFEKLKLLN
ncbi:hypothetical protein Lal_00031322 [Lupinus albus]|nr:hypothetical protein Lal_00031322 [Lupinus albus]